MGISINLNPHYGGFQELSCGGKFSVNEGVSDVSFSLECGNLLPLSKADYVQVRVDAQLEKRQQVAALQGDAFVKNTCFVSLFGQNYLRCNNRGNVTRKSEG